MVRIPAPGLPQPRRPLAHGDDGFRHWYENVLGWPTVPGVPLRLPVGVRFDVLDVPAEAGREALERLGRFGHGFPVARSGARMRLLVATGSAEELPGLLEWLDWGAPLRLDLTALGAGDLMEAPCPAGPAAGPSPGGAELRGPGRAPRNAPRGAAVWLRPPEPGGEAGASLPTLSAMGTSGTRGDGCGPPDLVRLVNTVATQIHRVRLRRARTAAAVGTYGQPLAFS